jgi:hypothetical protein
MKILESLTLAIRLPLCSLILFPLAVSAQPRLPVPFQGSFAVGAEASPNSGGSSFCGGSPADPLAIEAHGTGFSTLGAFIFTLHKTVKPGATPQSNSEYHGCLVLTAPNGDTLTANYDLLQPPGASDFSNAAGTLTVTGGTGRYKGATGSLKATGQFLSLYPANSFFGGASSPLQVAAFYVIDGTVLLQLGF